MSDAGTMRSGYGLAGAPFADGALGFWKALGEVWPTTREQRCWVHKTANVLNKLLKSQNRKLSEPLGNYSGIEACNEVGQTLALDQYVIPEALLRPRRVASEDRIDDILVLAKGMRDSVASAQLQTAIWLQAIVKLTGLLGEIGVMAGLINRVVEALVGVIVGIRGTVLRFLGARSMSLEQPAALFIRDSSGGEGTAHALERRHRLETLNNLLEAKAHDERPAAGVQLDHTNRGELHKRFTDGGT